MKKSMLLTVLFIVTFCVGSVAIASTSSGCYARPTDVAYEFQDAFPTTSDPADCPVSCGAWKTSCVAVVNAAGNCFADSLKGLQGLGTAECKAEHTGTDKTECINDIKASVSEGLVEISADRNQAKQDCNDAKPDCIAYCQAPPD